MTETLENLAARLEAVEQRAGNIEDGMADLSAGLTHVWRAPVEKTAVLAGMLPVGALDGVPPLSRCPKCFRPWCPNCGHTCGEVPKVYKDVWALLEALRAMKVCAEHVREHVDFNLLRAMLADIFRGTGRDLDGWIEYLRQEYAP